MKQEIISKAKAAQLFAENAVLFGRADALERVRANRHDRSTGAGQRPDGSTLQRA